MAKNFKFDKIILIVATVIAGVDVAAGSILVVNGEKAQITAAEASMLVNSGKALAASKENVAKIKAQIGAKVEAAAKAPERVNLQYRVGQLTLQVDTLTEQVAALTEQVTMLQAPGENDPPAG